MATWSLSDAALSSGAVVKAAGGGLPQRIGPPEPVQVSHQQYPASPGATSAVALSDGFLYYANVYNRLGKHRWDGSEVFGSSGPATSQYQMWVDEANNRLFCTRYFNLTTPVFVYQLSALPTLTLLATWPNMTGIWSFSPRSGLALPSGNVLISDWSGVWREYTWNGTFVQTFKSASVSGGGPSFYSGGYVYLGQADGVRKHDYATKALVQSYAWQSGGDAYQRDGYIIPGGGSGACFLSGTEIACHVGHNGIVLWNESTGTFSRVISKPGSIRGSGDTVRGLTPCREPGGTRVVLAGDAGDYSPRNYAQIVDTRLSRAQWSRTFATAATVKLIVTPGRDGSLLGSFSGEDFRRARYYHSVNGVDFTEFLPGTPMSVGIAAGATFTFRADLTAWGMYQLTPPWIGGDAGEGPSIIYTEDDPHGPDATVTVSTPAAIGVTVATPPRITVTVRS